MALWVLGHRDLHRKHYRRSVKWMVVSSFTRYGAEVNGMNAEEFLLLDTTGKARAGLGLDKNGEVGLVMVSRDGNRKLSLSLRMIDWP